MCVYVNGCMFVWVHGLGCVLQRSDPFDKIRTHCRDSDSCSQITWYTGDSKTDLWDDLERRTDSCSEDQMAIRIQNHVISCERLLLSYFLNYRCHLMSMFYSYYFMWPFDILYQYVYLYHFIRHQWTFNVFILLIWVFISVVSCAVIYHYWFRTSWGIPYTVTWSDLLIS